MALTNKHKKRIKDASLMVSSLRKMTEDMQSINDAYSKELDDILKALVLGKRTTKAQSNASTQTNAEVENADNTNLIAEKDPESAESTYSEKHENQSEQKEEKNLVDLETNNNAPPSWAKDLYKKILKICHPDKLNIKDTLDFEKKLHAGKSCLRYYNTGNYEYMIMVGGTVDTFTDKLSQNKQLEILNKIYAEDNQSIQSIQNSVSWKWGISWDEQGGRIRFLENFCRLKKIKPIPNRKQLQKILDEIENQ